MHIATTQPLFRTLLLAGWVSTLACGCATRRGSEPAASMLPPPIPALQESNEAGSSHPLALTARDASPGRMRGATAIESDTLHIQRTGGQIQILPGQLATLGDQQAFLEASGDLRQWDIIAPVLDFTEPLTVTPSDERKFYRLATSQQPEAAWCGTIDPPKRTTRTSAASPATTCMNGPPDDPALRNQFIPAAETPMKIIRMRFHIVAEDDGSSPSLNPTQLPAIMNQVNAAFAPWKISFQYTYRTVNDSTLLNLSRYQFATIRDALTEDPTRQLNVFVTSIRDVLGIGALPWGLRADFSDSGLMLGVAEEVDEYASTFIHEIGHCLGLYHTQHGRDEVSDCSTCYESPASDRDRTGDLCADTPPNSIDTPCEGDQGVIDPCSNQPWPAGANNNYMSYSECRTRFTPQQAGRMHAWIEYKLMGWVVQNTQLPALSLAAVINSNGQAELSWTYAPGQASQFLIQRSTNGLTGWTSFTTLEPARSWIDQGATANQLYYYRIRAEQPDAGAYSGFSPAITLITPPPAGALQPPVLLGLTEQSTGVLGVQVKWQDASSISTDFTVEQLADEEYWSPVASGLGLTNRHGCYMDDDVLPGSNYAYRVTATAPDGSTATSSVMSIRLTSMPVNPPSDTMVLQADLGGLVVFWRDRSENEDGFVIERSVDSVTYSVIGTTGAISRTAYPIYLDNAVQEDQRYWYRVRATRAGFRSPHSSPASGVSRSLNAPTNSPALLSPTPETVEVRRRANFAWNPVRHASSYRLQIFQVSSGGAMIREYVIAGATTFVVPDEGMLPGDRRFEWRVQGYNQQGAGPWSGKWLFRTRISAPELVSPAPDATGISRTTAFSWAASSGAENYTFEIAADAPAAANIVTRRTATTTSLSTRIPADDPLRANRNFYWRVRATGPTTSQESEWRHFVTGP